jgi:hypothetical protein
MGSGLRALNAIATHSGADRSVASRPDIPLKVAMDDLWRETVPVVPAASLRQGFGQARGRFAAGPSVDPRFD